MSSDLVKDVNWSAAHSSFPFTVQALRLEAYSYKTLLGLIISVGGLTESLVSWSCDYHVIFIACAQVRSSSVNLLLYLNEKRY